MPPIAKFKREEIVDCALKIVESRGGDALTARSLGEMLGSSPRPIFTIFQSMEEVFQEVMKKAYGIYRDYLNQGLKEEYPFKGAGKAYIRFAGEHPKLFQLLFMSEADKVPDIRQVLHVIEEEYERVLGSITSTFHIDDKIAEKLYQHLWIYSHGIAVLIATKVCKFSEEEISNMLTEVFIGLLTSLKNKGE